MTPATGGARDIDTLLRDVGQGSPLAFADLYDAISPRVYGLALGIVANRTIADEIIHQVFLRIWDTATDFDHTCHSARTWILAIAHRCSVESARANLASPLNRVQAEPPLRRDAPTGASGSGLEAVELAYFQGLSQQQIATRTGAPVATVKTIMRAGLSQVRAASGEAARPQPVSAES